MPEFKTVAGQRFVRYRRSDSIIWGVLGIALVGAIFLGVGIRDSMAREEFLADSLAAPGIVTYQETVSPSSRTSSAAYRPVVQFTPEGAKTPVTFVSPYVGSRRYAEGEEVTVRYRPEHPEVANIEEVLTSHTYTAGYILIGAAVLLAAGSLLKRLNGWMAVPPTRTVSFR